MWGCYGSKIVGVFSRPLNEVLGLTTNILWWYRPSFYGGLCCICFSRNWTLVAPLNPKNMHPSFESLVVISTPGLQVSLMDNQNDTSFKSILEDDSISSSYKACICSSSNKGAGLWLIVRPFIVHFTSHILLSPQHYVFASI